jgi:large subunit ribosomal protein L5
MKNDVHKKLERSVPVKRFLEKIVINAGVGRASQQAQFEEKTLPQIMKDIAALAGQAPRVRRSYKSIAGFKMREGQIVGVQVTLRGAKMFDFFKRFITIVLPRVRDFNGLELSSIDHSGALNIGLKEQYVFSEITPEESPFGFSLGVSMVPKMRDRMKALGLYGDFGVPMKRDDTQKIRSTKHEIRNKSK